ncbi:MAG: DMT family transporter [archaeon]|nr:MAG: DMT family transporter [archaeon]
MASIRPYALLITLSVIWGMAFVAIRQADFELDSNNLTLLRWLIVSAAFLILYRFIVRPKAKFERKDFPRLIVVAATSVAIYHLSLNASEKIVNASLAGLLISLAPLTTVLLSSIVLHEKISSRIWGALVLAIAGAVVISSPDLSLTGAAFGPGLVVVAAMAGATFTVSSKPLVAKYGPYPVAAWAAFLGTAMLLPLVTPGLLTQAEGLSATGWLSVLYLAILSTVIANMIFYTLVSRQALSKLGVQLYLVPIVSAVGGVLLLGEQLGVATLVGGALLLVAVGLATSGRH